MFHVSTVDMFFVVVGAEGAVVVLVTFIYLKQKKFFSFSIEPKTLFFTKFGIVCAQNVLVNTDTYIDNYALVKCQFVPNRSCLS